MIQRNLKQKIIDSLNHFPIVSILGARQVGKTTLAKMIAGELDINVIYLDLEMPSDINKLKEPELFFKSFRDSLVIIDEIQRMPDLFPLLRALVDSYKRNSCFLILGSSSPSLKRQSSESLAGRIVYYELTPFMIEEINSLDKLWLRGGFPPSYLAESDEISLQWRLSLISTYLEKDIPQLGFHIPSIQLHRFWQMIAHSQGKLWNASKIAGSMGLTAPTVRHYLDILNDTFIVRQLLPYFPNIKKRLVKSPKIYIRDTGLLHAFLGIGTFENLIGNPSAGESWEGLIIEQIAGIIPEKYELYFYRTSAGAEIDLVLLSGKEPPVAIEIKRTLSPSVTKGFHHAFSDIKAKKGFIIYPGNEYYPLSDKIFALPVDSLKMILD